MFDSVTVIGLGRAGTTIASRLRERGVGVREDGALRLLCVPDRAIAEVAQSLEPGPWVAHVSGATPLAALDPHTRRFSLHPLQTFTKDGGPGQLDGAWGGFTAETPEAEARALWLAETLGLKPFRLADDRRAVYHAGAAVASNFLVTLHRIAADLMDEAGVPAEALVPLMRRTIDNGFQLTGPIVRGDWETVERHRDVLHRTRYAQVYDALAEATRP